MAFLQWRWRRFYTASAARGRCVWHWDNKRCCFGGTWMTGKLYFITVGTNSPDAIAQPASWASGKRTKPARADRKVFACGHTVTVVSRKLQIIDGVHWSKSLPEEQNSSEKTRQFRKIQLLHGPWLQRGDKPNRAITLKFKSTISTTKSIQN